MPTGSAAKPQLRFGAFVADLEAGELYRNGIRVRIQWLPFQALRHFLENPNEVISREQLRQTLWPEDVHVDFDRGIISAIKRLRDALNDSAENPIFVETVGRRGYRWIFPLQTAAQRHAEAGPPATSSAPKSAVQGEDDTVRPDSRMRSRFALAALLAAVLILASAIGWQARRQAGNSAGQSEGRREAVELYFKGRYYWEKRTPESLTLAVDAFTQSIVRDSSYAPAYVGLADAYNLEREFAAMPAAEAYARTYAAARRAAELDPKSSDAHATLGFVSFFGMWQPAEAEREFRRSIELNPSNVNAHHWFASCLQTLRRHREALEEIERAEALDPGSKSVVADRGVLLWAAGRRQEGLNLLRQMEASDPEFVSPHRYLGSILFETGDYAGALQELSREAELSNNSVLAGRVTSASRALASGGPRAMLTALKDEDRRLVDEGRWSPYDLARDYARLGDRRHTLDTLRTALDRRDDQMTKIYDDRAFEAFRGDPEFHRLVASMQMFPQP